jgi:hypothetical protein
LSTHGITDALRDAEFLARCLTRRRGFDDLDEFVTARACVIDSTFDVMDRIASYGWDIGGLRRDLLAMSSAMSMELKLMSLG